MGSTKQLHEIVHPMFCKKLEGKVPKKIIGLTSLLVATMIIAKTSNTMDLANMLPKSGIKVEALRQTVWRYLKNENVHCEVIMAPFVSYVFDILLKAGDPVILSLDQSDIESRFAVLMIAVKFGNRALPVAWCVQMGEANIGFEEQETLLEQVIKLIPEGANVVLTADRFYPSVKLIKWLQIHQWRYRLRLKKNVLVEMDGDRSKIGQLAKDVEEKYLPGIHMFSCGLETNIGIIHEPEHPEPWLIAMDCPPTKEAVLEYSGRWCIEPMFSDFKSRGFGLEDSQLSTSDRIERLILIMALSMYCCVFAGLEDSLKNPSYEEKKFNEESAANPTHWSIVKVYRSMCSWFKRGLRWIERAFQHEDVPMPNFIYLSG